MRLLQLLLHLARLLRTTVAAGELASPDGMAAAAATLAAIAAVAGQTASDRC